MRSWNKILAKIKTHTLEILYKGWNDLESIVGFNPELTLKTFKNICDLFLNCGKHIKPFQLLNGWHLSREQEITVTYRKIYQLLTKN